MVDTTHLEDDTPSVAALVVTGAVFAATLVSFAAALRSFSGDDASCDVYCGPAANLIVAYGIWLGALVLWCVSVVASIGLVRRPGRRWLGVVGMVVVLAPPCVLVAMAISNG
jgi:hypothetical protein